MSEIDELILKLSTEAISVGVGSEGSIKRMNEAKTALRAAIAAKDARIEELEAAAYIPYEKIMTQDEWRGLSVQSRVNCNALGVHVAKLEDRIAAKDERTINRIEMSDFEIEPLSPEDVQALIDAFSKFSENPDAERYNHFDNSPENVLATLNRIASLDHCLGELLAVIHGDGGQYREEHGDAQATDDALDVVRKLRERIDELEEVQSLKPRIYVHAENEPEYEITDLYWFEENGVHVFDETGHWGQKYTFRFTRMPLPPVQHEEM
jgi:hypothetical protein